MQKTEKQIQEFLGVKLNNTMNHLMKDKHTASTIFPTSGLWKDEVIFKTTNTVMQPSGYSDPDLNKLHHIKMNQFKKFDEEMQKSKNMLKKTGNADKKDEKKEKKVEKK